MSAKKFRILLVDDDAMLLALVSKWLESAGYETVSASDGSQAVQAINDHCPHIMVTDWQMPNMDGMELVRWVRKQELPNYVYTIFVTSCATSQDMVSALEAGADDFLKKPVDKAELLARVRSGVRVLELESRLKTLAKTDPLTGLATRRTFLEHMEREWSRAKRHRIPISCVMIDIDFFKRINDTLGHRAGDQAIRGLARILEESCRDSDLIGRYGGEEFCVLLPETNEENAGIWADRVRRHVASRNDLIEGSSLTLTASFGVAERLADTGSPTELLDLADQALLVAKRSGRDRVVGFQTINQTPELGTESGPGQVFSGLLARDVMTTMVAGLNQNESVGRAARYFLRFRFNSAPVVDDQGQLVGILSERDVMAIMMWPKWWTTTIKEVMKSNVVCYEEDTPVLLIYEFLSRVLIRGVVIVKDGRPTGQISRSSLLRWFTNMLATNSAREHEGPLLDLDDDPEIQSVTPEPRDNVTMIARALARQATDLERRIQTGDMDLVPLIVGGVSRIEELVNDLLAFSRFANNSRNATDQSAESNGSDTVSGLAAFAAHLATAERNPSQPAP